MTRLRALIARFAPLALQLLLRALPRELTALLTRQRRIRGRRHRTVQRRPILLPLKLQHTLPQPGHLINRIGHPIQRVKQPDHELPSGLPAGQRDRFSVRSIHARKIPSIQKDSCSPRRHHLNAYQSVVELKTAVSSHFTDRNAYFKENPRRAGKKIWDVDFFEDSTNLRSGVYREW